MSQKNTDKGESQKNSSGDSPQKPRDLTAEEVARLTPDEKADYMAELYIYALNKPDKEEK